jgi:aminoglycoside phosphotransferase family enzyme/predicted kinase
MVEALRASCLSLGETQGNEPSVEVIQTHASLIMLLASRVYKLKKPKNFGFFDYSTPAQRRHFCQQEVLLNAAFAPGVYLGVAPVLAFDSRQVRFGEPVPPEVVPQPGEVVEGATVVDYAVVMARLPETATLESSVREGRATPQLLEEVAHFVATFHADARTDEGIARSGSLETIRYNWEENFRQMQPYVGRTLDAATYERIRGYASRFLASRRALFASRVREGHIRDGHGDLRLQHLYLLPDGANHVKPRIVLLDRIEFAERFRCGDVASEVAFLAMELDALSRADLADVFVAAYVARTGDAGLRELLPFYLCYRACVRGKVASFQLDEAEVSLAQREAAGKQAEALFALAEHYASGSPRAMMILVGGLMGTGKSTLARALHETTGASLLSSDLLRKRLAGLDPRQPEAAAFGQGVYSLAWTRRTYQALGDEAEEVLAQGHSVLLDASFVRRADRAHLAQRATERGAPVIFIECVCPRDTTILRLARRWSERIRKEPERGADGLAASDGRPELYDAQQARWEAFSPAAEPRVRHVVVHTDQPLSHTLEQALEAIDYPRLTCRVDEHGHASFP